MSGMTNRRNKRLVQKQIWAVKSGLSDGQQLNLEMVFDTKEAALAWARGKNLVSQYLFYRVFPVVMWQGQFTPFVIRLHGWFYEGQWVEFEKDLFQIMDKDYDLESVVFEQESEEPDIVSAYGDFEFDGSISVEKFLTMALEQFETGFKHWALMCDTEQILGNGKRQDNGNDKASDD